MSDIVKKVCMCGDPNVGKTSLVRRFVSGKYDEKYISTLGTHVSKKTVKAKGSTITMMIWDVSGQPEFKRIHHSAFKNSAGGLAVCDATRPETAEHLNDWICNLRSVAGSNVPVVILSNKTDLAGDEAPSYAKIETIADKYGCSLFTTSAKTGVNVEDAFKVMATAVSGKPAPGEEQPAPEDLEVPNDIYTPAEFLDFMAISFCKMLGDEEMGMHMVRKQVKDEGFDFRTITADQARALISKLAPLIEQLNGADASRKFNTDMLKNFEKVRS